ncbi:MAG: hypothetical protein AAF669_08315, partial [Pseudomonadota bacterium]
QHRQIQGQASYGVQAHQDVQVLCLPHQLMVRLAETQTRFMYRLNDKARTKRAFFMPPEKWLGSANR